MLNRISLFQFKLSIVWIIGSALNALPAKYFASPQGLPDQSGLTRDAATEIRTALAKLGAGDTLVLASGHYAIPYVAGKKNTITLSAQGTSDKPITVLGDSAADGVNLLYAEIDFSFPEEEWVQDSYGILVSGSYWRFTRVSITRAGYQGAYVTGQHNSFDRCAFYENRNSGLEINKGGAYTTVRHCDTYRNYDPKKFGSMADGFAPKQTQGPGNRFYDCRAWENSDDGYDTYDSPDSVLFENCWAFRNGVDIWKYGGFEGNGNGFKVGGNYKLANNRLVQCIAFGQPGKGFDQNNNKGGITFLNCLAYRNGTNFGLSGSLEEGQSHVIRNSISFGADNDIKNVLEDKNSWSVGLSVGEGDFISLDTTLATVPRRADGSVPVTDLFRLIPQSILVNAGGDVGLSFVGSAPDIGAFETGASVVTGLRKNPPGLSFKGDRRLTRPVLLLDGRTLLGRRGGLGVTGFSKGYLY
jgi:hypothetical protein